MASWQATSTIVDANLDNTFCCAFVCTLLGSGPIKGFSSITLGIGVITSMFSAVLVTRMFVACGLNWRRPAKLVL